jgi:hypothetical protein
MFAVRCVESETVQLLIVMLKPKLQTVVEFTKFVFEATTAIERLIASCVPDDGFSA